MPNNGHGVAGSVPDDHRGISLAQWRAAQWEGWRREALAQQKPVVAAAKGKPKPPRKPDPWEMGYDSQTP